MLTNIGGVAWFYRPDTIDLSVIDHVYTQNGYHFPGDMNDWFVVDVGAHIGAASIAAAKRGAHILAYEPCQANYDLLRKNVIENHVTVYTEPFGVGPRGLHKLYLDRKNTGQNSMFLELNDLHDNDFESIICWSLEDVLGGRSCDLLKLDCEGGEVSILNEILDGLYPKVDRIAVEFHFIPEAQQQIDQLSRFYNIESLGSNEYMMVKK